MLNNISWASYLYAITIIVPIYYGFVLIVYYRNDLQSQFLKFKSSFNSSSVSRKFSLEQNGVEIIEHISKKEDENTSLPELLLNIQSLIKTGAARNFPREELLLSLQLQLQQQSALKDSIHKERINDFIIEACENYCSIHLSADEVSALWIK
ncbi:MAG: hypothetical protein ABI707_20065 [Ferruginibacter sp.]